jgi:hypothetical protein
MTAWAMLRASVPARERSVLCWFYGSFAVLACVIAVTLPKPDSKLPLLVMGLPTLLAWGGWFVRLLLLQRQMRTALLPGGDAAIVSALALALAATVALPALGATAWGLPWWLALSAFAAMAAAGALVLLLPRGIVPVIGLLPLAWDMAGIGPLAISGNAAILPASAAVLVAACAWRWMAVVRGGSGRLGEWSQPFVLAVGERGSLWRTSTWSDPSAQLAAQPGWMQAGVQLAGVGPSRPVRAMRTWLGGPFAPMSRRVLMVQVALWLLAAVAGWRWVATSRHGADAGGTVLAFVLLVGGAMLAAIPALRLQALKRATSAEMAELALLPGWGGTPVARGLVLAAVAGTLARTLAATALVAIGVAMWLHEDAQRFALVLVALLASSSAGAATCMRALAGQSFDALGGWLAVLVGGLLLVLTTTAFGERVMDGWLAATLAAWCALALWSALALRAAWSRWQAQAHPFLAAAPARP